MCDNPSVQTAIVNLTTTVSAVVEHMEKERLRANAAESACESLAHQLREAEARLAGTQAAADKLAETPPTENVQRDYECALGLLSSWLVWSGARGVHTIGHKKAQDILAQKFEKLEDAAANTRPETERANKAEAECVQLRRDLQAAQDAANGWRHSWMALSARHGIKVRSQEEAQAALRDLIEDTKELREAEEESQSALTRTEAECMELKNKLLKSENDYAATALELASTKNELASERLVLSEQASALNFWANWVKEVAPDAAKSHSTNELRTCIKERLEAFRVCLTELRTWEEWANGITPFTGAGIQGREEQRAAIKGLTDADHKLAAAQDCLRNMEADYAANRAELKKRCREVLAWNAWANGIVYPAGVDGQPQDRAAQRAAIQVLADAGRAAQQPHYVSPAVYDAAMASAYTELRATVNDYKLAEAVHNYVLDMLKAHGVRK